MDRNAIIGFILIGLILMVWMWMNSPEPVPVKLSQRSDTSAVQHSSAQSAGVATHRTTDSQPTDSLGTYFSHLATNRGETISVHTPHFNALLSTLGAGITSWEMNKFNTWDGHKANLINESGKSDLNLLFYSSDGKLINTRNLRFEQVVKTSSYDLSERESAKIEFVLKVGDGKKIIKTYTFHKDSYAFDVDIELQGMRDVISNYEYQVVWEGGLRYPERNSVDESNSAMAYAFAGGELTEVDAANFDEEVKQNISGRVQWVASRTKYFALALIARDLEPQGAYLEGVRHRKPDNGAQEQYNIGLKIPFRGGAIERSKFTVFLGPLDYDIIKGLNVELDRVMSLGAVWVIRPIAEHVMIPLFQFLHLFIPNFGIVIIIFAFIIKVVLHPLTKSQMTSMRKMQALQPMMEEIREKHKDDPQKMNQQVMRLYKEYGVNPAGGCLPLLLQLPILYALWSVFHSAIELRQASFFGWIHDLSIPDVVLTLPFPIPIFGIHELSGLAGLMGVTMFVQQKMTVKDPRQKMMIWMMPILMTLLFMSFPSGLNLYYFVFNLLSIVQQQWVNKRHENEPLQKVDEKKSNGFMSRLMKNLPKPKQ